MRELFPSENPSQSQNSNSNSNKKTLDKNLIEQTQASQEANQEAKKIWAYITEELYSQLGEDLCKKWIFPIRAQASNEDELVLIVPSINFYQVILSEYLELIERCKNKLGFEHISTVIDLDREPQTSFSTDTSGTTRDTHDTTENPDKKTLFGDSPSLSRENINNREYTRETNKSHVKTKKRLIKTSESTNTSNTFMRLPPLADKHNLVNNQTSNSVNNTNDSKTYEFNTTHSSENNDDLQNDIVGWGKIESLVSYETERTPIHSSSDTLFSHTLSRKTKLNPNYTFDTFVRGPSNQFALAACYNVAENPGKTYNPLFIYGSTGLGKTHLLHAVGNHIIKTNPKATVAYISSERFMNELIYCLRHNKIIDFRQKYRHCDLFLMDDIQFISGNKAATQEEFFHTFNTLYEAKKQIIITSDLFPQDIPDIEERLRNRFQWGLIADIQPPDIEHRIAILFSKAEQLGIRLSIDVAEYIANFVKRNIRELEGALHRLDAFATLHGRTLDKALAIETFSNMLSEEPSKNQMLIDTVQKVVADHFQVKTSELKSKRRHKALTLPRQVAMYLSRKFTKTSYPEIGEKFGGKDHTTVIHAVRKITSERKKNMDIIVHLDALERVLERLN